MRAVVLTLLLLSMASAVVVMRRPASRGAELRLWAFDAVQARQWRAIADDFERAQGRSVAIEVMSTRALETRLLSLQSSDAPPTSWPDVVAIEMSSAGKFLREGSSLLPVDAWLDAPHEPPDDRRRPRERLIDARLNTWSVAGIAKPPMTLGVPVDVHPVLLAYRKDVLPGASEASTWEELGQRVQAAMAESAKPRVAVGAGDLVTLLMQRGVRLVDERGRSALAQPEVVDTVARLAHWTDGPRAWARAATGGDRWIEELERGEVVAMPMPDWRWAVLERRASASLLAKLRVRPLPVFERGDVPTSTHGGTMLAIPRKASDAQRSWRLIEHLIFSDVATRVRSEQGVVLPALLDAPPPASMRADAAELYARLAGQVPTREAGPTVSVAHGRLGIALLRARQWVREGKREDELRRAIEAELHAADAAVDRYAEFLGR